MPAALYGVSFKKTGHLLAICSFEKRPLADAAAAQQLLQDLAGQHLTISAWLRAPIRVDLDQLAVDPIRGQASPADKIANVYGYQVMEATGTTLGDGKEKELAPWVVTNPVTSLALGVGAPGKLTVTLNANDPAAQDAWVLFEGGLAPVKGTSKTTQTSFDIPLGLPIVAHTSYGLLLLKSGVPATSAYVTAP